MIGMPDVTTRRATASDAAFIADAHRDSIRSIGPAFYPARVVEDWQEGLEPAVYLEAMGRGEVFFIAEHHTHPAEILGFASDYAIAGAEHGTSVYVRGKAARRGLGSSLLHLAETHATETGAATIHIEASLAAVEFYAANGYRELGRGETHLISGRPIACVFMRKELRRAAVPNPLVAG